LGWREDAHGRAAAEELCCEFLLDPEIAFLNHGSWALARGRCSSATRPWQRELECEPVDFLGRRLPDVLDAARSALAAYVGCAGQDLAFVQNATTGVNLAVRDRSRRVARDARRELRGLLGTEPLAPESMVAQMAAVRLPHPAPGLSERLFTRDRIEVPVGGAGEDVLRLSVAAYTTRDEIDRLLAALVRELDAEHGQQDE
jgi:selenocysteine lyase/cysteine desulfurase